MSKLAIAGLLTSGLKLPEYDEELEALRFELEAVRIDYRARLEGRQSSGLFGLSFELAFLQRERALLQFARDNRISLKNNDWRQKSIERIAWNWIDAQSSKPKRGRPRKRRGGLLAGPADDASILDELELIRTWARKNGRGSWSDAKCIKLYVIEHEFEGNEPTSDNQQHVLVAHCRTWQNKVSRLRTKLKRKPG